MYINTNLEEENDRTRLSPFSRRQATNSSLNNRNRGSYNLPRRSWLKAIIASIASESRARARRWQGKYTTVPRRERNKWEKSRDSRKDYTNLTSATRLVQRQNKIK